MSIQKILTCFLFLLCNATSYLYAQTDTVETDTLAPQQSLLRFSKTQQDSMRSAHASLRKDSSNTDTAQAILDSANLFAIDTTYRVWHKPFVGIGVGWEFGNMPVYEQWDKGLPTHIIDTVSIMNNSFIFALPLTTKEKPTIYNVSFPIKFSITPIVRKQFTFTIFTDFYWMNKNSKAVLIRDKDTIYYSMEKKLTVLSPGLGILASLLIPDTYFSITKSQQSSLFLGIAGSPFVLLRDKVSLEPLGYTSTNNYNGLSFSWKAGIATMRMLSPTSALLSEFTYTGSINGHFMSDGYRVTNKYLNPNDEYPDENLSFVSARFMLSFTLIRGKKPPEVKQLPGTGTTIPVNQPNTQTNQ